MSHTTTADATVRTTDSGAEHGDTSGESSDGSDCDGDDDPSIRRATRVMRLLKLAATTLAALVGVAKALGFL